MSEKIVMDEETRQKLIGILPFDKSAKYEHTPDFYEDVDEEYRPVFLLRTLTKAEQSEMKRLMKKQADGKSDIDEALREIVRKTVVGWDNLIDVGACDYIEYDTDDDGFLKMELLDMLPVLVIGDLAYKIVSISGLTGAARTSLK